MNMRRLIGVLVSVAALLVWVPAIHAQDQLVPAGTLLQCTLDEPNFSSATAAVGDPVLCHLRTMQQFGKPLFPRGSMLGGHLEADQEPGHFVGKGYLRITFDRVILPSGDLPVPAKVILARGYKVDKQGAIDGKGHPKRDVVEWMIPPLWPWKVVSLPFRGPRPTLKGEEPLELRLMDDIVVPRTLAQVSHPDRPPYASYARPSSYKPAPHVNAMQLAVDKNSSTASQSAGLHLIGQPPSNGHTSETATVLVTKSHHIYEVAKYQRDGDLLMFQDTQGRKGGVYVNEVDWRMTTGMTMEAHSGDKLPTAQTN
jgi:hypothetical protein